MPVFLPPVDRVPFAPPFERFKYERGRTVYRKGGVWFETTSPPLDEIVGADAVPVADRPGGERTDGTRVDRYLFIGGKRYEISAAVAAELTAAGYGARIS